MATSKAETAFTKALVAKLSPSIYVEKTNNPFRKGMPDLYIEGDRILWTEVKYIAKPWDQDLSSEKLCNSKSWITQRLWLERTHRKGHLARVIVGVGPKKQVYILSYPFDFLVSRDSLISIEEAAKVLNSCVSLTPK